MTNNDLKREIEICKLIVPAPCKNIIDLAEKVIALGESCPKERTDGGKGGYCGELWAKCYNRGRTDMLLFIAWRLGKVEDILRYYYYAKWKDEEECVEFIKKKLMKLFGVKDKE